VVDERVVHAAVAVALAALVGALVAA